MTWLSRIWAGACWALRTEWRMYVGVWRLLSRRPDVPTGSRPIRYVGAVSVLLWAFTVLSVVELAVVHVVLPWEKVRLAADVLGIWGVVWILGMTGCHYVYPHLVTDRALRVRHTERKDLVTVPWDLLRSASTRERSLSTSRRLLVSEDEGVAVLNVVVGSRTNVDLRLHRPLAVTVRDSSHVVEEVRLFADDPGDLVRQVRDRAQPAADRVARRSQASPSSGSTAGT